MENRHEEILDALTNFVLRLLKGPATEKEATILPQITELCLKYQDSTPTVSMDEVLKKLEDTAVETFESTYNSNDETSIENPLIFDAFMAIQNEINRFYRLFELAPIDLQTDSSTIKRNSERLKKTLCKFIDTQTDSFIKTAAELDRISKTQMQRI